jgi:hypothetical protein
VLHYIRVVVHDLERRVEEVFVRNEGKYPVDNCEGHHDPNPLLEYSVPEYPWRKMK